MNDKDQVSMAIILSAEAEKIRDLVRDLADTAKEAELHDFADGFNIIADGASRMSVELATRGMVRSTGGEKAVN
jgi:hypothetical protein